MEFGKTVLNFIFRDNARVLEWYESYQETTEAFVEQLKAAGETVQEGVSSVRQNLDD